MPGPAEAGTSTVEIRLVTTDDRAALSAFSCHDFRAPWTGVVQEMVREHLVDALAQGVSAVGLWIDGRLAAVAAWRFEDPDPSGLCLCHGVLLAVQDGHVRRGYGQRLKQELIERARQAGAAAVVSVVHWDNDPMIRLNAALGANIHRIANDPDHCRCVIPLQRD